MRRRAGGRAWGPALRLALLALPLGLSALLVPRAAEAGGAPRVERVEVDGNRVLSGSEVRALVGIPVGAPFDSAVASAGLDALLARYRDAGRLLAEARLELAGDSARVRVWVHVSEGPPGRVAGFEVLG
ncbi:MAG TPA: POTRA domain-containing protein, partial [Candidatus Saccharimonadales bacterium]|nr:POTRA domain-containing protein [Candidatus Saccharimonadales bacterium]